MIDEVLALDFLNLFDKSWRIFVKRRKFVSLVGLAATTSGLLIACGGTPTATNSPAPGETVAANGAAQADQALVVYSGRNEELIGQLIEQFETDTGIQVDVRYGDTAELAATILEEGNNSPADIFFGQDAGALGALQAANRTRPIPDALLKQVDARFQSQQGQWLGVSGRARVIDYNTQLVEEADLPNSIWDLTEPQWKGRVGWAPTNGSFQAFVTALRKAEGDERALEWLQAMKANEAQDFRNNTTIVEALGRGEIALGLVNNYYLVRFKKDDPNFPVEHHYTQDDAGAMVNVAGVAIVDTTDQPEAAEQFVEYLLSPTAQTYFAEQTGEYPLVSGIEATAQQKSLTEIDPPDIDLSDLSDLEGTLALLQEAGVL